MALPFPYIFISCPCSDVSNRELTSKRSSRDVELDQEIQDDEETFDPRHPRSAFSLFPPEHLLYCEECHEIKCPRCVTEEINATYCPDCLFESPKVMVRGEGNRCPRNCFHCPICTSQMITASVGDPKNGPFILNCNYCMWSTLDVGIKFDKPTGIRGQLDEIANGGEQKAATVHSPYSYQADYARKSSLSRPPLSPADRDEIADPKEDSVSATPLDPTARFNALKTFYKEQITESSATDATFSTSALDMAYSSPSSLQRIMNLYTNKEGATIRARQKLTVMREARSASEGFALAASRDSGVESQSPRIDYDETVTASQRAFQYPSFIGNPAALKVSELRPMPTLMRTKRSKRCATCKHILARPELKISSARYRIKLIALNYVPFVTIKPLPIAGGLPPPGPDGGDVILTPGKPVQFIMTLRNPLFDDVSVSLGTPSVTPGRHGHRVTILCPQFRLGKNSDAWDDALSNNNQPDRGTGNIAGGEQVAGKLYDQGRNWASVVLEIIPASIVRQQSEELDEDEDVIEIPIRVRLEWTVTDDEAGMERRKRDTRLDEGDDIDDGKRELNYWMVVGIGRVAC
ncbi:hypothetical protein A1O1_05809 [Capronia coronata CBS 617.96]|uniref:Dynactin subunit 4 n=1 Tax=Capronia coronata CBS 617.96 TaxID=1182541 RepID=W9Y750_9EURO|nr:uncharacterized protein A1O1_05809 [Capronia coronata CBS 617.96]EXJ85445.1 hypothetical protein A1O1_05809 [Capronia coronata CBS 617.96]